MKFLCLFALLIGCLGSKVDELWEEAEIEAMNILRETLDVPFWEGAPTCKWAGVGCSRGRVHRIELPSRGLKGYLPAEIGELSELKVLDLSMNEIHGSIPPEIGECQFLLWFWIPNNHLIGTIPKELGTIKNLKQIVLNNNQLTGVIPNELGNLWRNLENINLQYNQLTGNIPSELGELLALRMLTLSNNNFTGQIPRFGKLKLLQKLLLQSNQLSGNFSFEVENILALRELRLDHNNITGSFPASFEMLMHWPFCDVRSNPHGCSATKKCLADLYCIEPGIPIDHVQSGTMEQLEKEKLEGWEGIDNHIEKQRREISH